MTGADVGGAGQRVALRKESVDRNKHPEPTEQTKALVALRKESVDRNDTLSGTRRSSKSLSARRAWIEIIYQ